MPLKLNKKWIYSQKKKYVHFLNSLIFKYIRCSAAVLYFLFSYCKMILSFFVAQQTENEIEFFRI